MKYYWFSIIFIMYSFSAIAEQRSPDCSGANGWAASMAFVHMKNDGILDNEDAAFPPKIMLISSQKIGADKYYSESLYRQVHKISFTKKSGDIIEVVTVNDVTKTECSMGGVDVYVISKHLGGM